ncbi:MAG: carbamoyl phosphate synthase small subunit, partial [Candidatus Omnitrophica bacterium]|nr:carbamoyl phosphate synthase small subunit [Candidatus Omnitrophota bacterium]
KTYNWKEQGSGAGIQKTEFPKKELRIQYSDKGSRDSQGRFKVVVIDCGVKFNILRVLVAYGCEVVVVPANTSAEQILAHNPNGLMISNGPGDPAAVPYVAQTIRELIEKQKKNDFRLPMMGICLGQQILGLAMGGKTHKLKFGHHGGNHPVKDMTTGKVYISAQNHGFCVDIDSLNKDEIEITHTNLNDQTLEGIRHRKLPVFSVQFHPECSPGPHDAEYLFENFIDMMIKEY